VTNQTDDIAARIRAFILNDILRNPDFPLTDDEPLITGGLIDSHALVEIAVFLEREFDVVVPDTELTPEHLDSVADMAQRVRREHAQGAG